MRLPLVLLLAVASTSAVAASALEAAAQERRDESYSARGVVQSFEADRRTVNIAHEAIPGFMDAMTMSFEAATPEQLNGLAAGDRVRFTFRVTSEGRRILVSIVKD